MISRFAWLLVSAAGYVGLTYGVPRAQFWPLIGLFGLLTAGYYWLCRRVIHPLHATDSDRQPDWVLFGAAVVFRLLLVGAIPNLSDDAFRFIWDGRLLAHGYNPYQYLPSALVDTPLAIRTGLSRYLYERLNSPHYYTVYPPVNQAFFALAGWVAPGPLPQSLLPALIGLRLPILLGDIAVIWLLTVLLSARGLSPNLALLYALNPLVIVELTGNIHFEGVMIGFTLLAIWLAFRQRWVLAALALALAIGTKLLPLMLLPLAVAGIGWKRGLWLAGLTGLFTLALFAPFASMALLQNMGASLDLYFQKFEFNASFYYLVRAVGYWIRGYNTIETVGVGLSLLTTLGLLALAFWPFRLSVSGRVLASLTLYFLMATTVHPWYLTTLVAASVFTHARYPLLWSVLVPLSYFTYARQPYHENLWLTALEYLPVLALACWEWRQPQQSATGPESRSTVRTS
ncbi:DUF2029 domain-containing protein [Spirosoma luteolum]